MLGLCWARKCGDLPLALLHVYMLLKGKTRVSNMKISLQSHRWNDPQELGIFGIWHNFQKILLVDIFFKDICKLTSRVSKTRDCFRLEFHVHQGPCSHLHDKVLVQCNLLIENNQSNNRLNLKNVICYIF